MTFEITFLRVPISNEALAGLSAYAQQYKTSPESAAGLFLEGKFGGGPVSRGVQHGPVRSPSDAAPAPNQPFLVAEHFLDYPRRSIDLAQGFVDRATKLSEVRAFKHGRGVGLRPRVAQIEYILSYRSKKPGIVASVWGSPQQFADPRGLLKADRKSYSRARIYNPEDLEYFMVFVEQAYERRHGDRDRGPQA